MIAELLPDEAIPPLLDKLDLEMVKALRAASLPDFIPLEDVKPEQAEAFGRLVAIGCIDAVAGWMMNHNGRRLLRLWDTPPHADEDAPPVNAGEWLPPR